MYIKGSKSFKSQSMAMLDTLLHCVLASDFVFHFSVWLTCTGTMLTPFTKNSVGYQI